MILLRPLLALFLVLAVAACSHADAQNLGYDPARDPVADLAHAKQEAAQTGKHVMIVAGGDWCRWCHALHDFLSDNDDVQAELDRKFVTVKVYVGDDNGNDAFFDALPPAPGYPHFWVLGKDGIAHSIGTSSLEAGDDGYDKERFMAMLQSASQL